LFYLFSTVSDLFLSLLLLSCCWWNLFEGLFCAVTFSCCHHWCQQTKYTSSLSSDEVRVLRIMRILFWHLRRAILKVSSEKCTLMSDHDKELLKAEEVLENQVIKAYCCHHLKENFVMKFEHKLTSFIMS